MPDGYGVPQTDEGLVTWSHVVERLEEARSYWVATLDPQSRPHVRPIWGGFVEGTLYVEGGPTTRWARNLAANPVISVHLESGDDVVIVEGTAHEVRPEPALAAQLAERIGAKYRSSGYEPTPDQWDRGGLWAIRPRTVLAWAHFPQDATAFRFGD
jgi:nitroimidazol reductase NimA-like FMN-containing flavoprotein (pyridoxamine 5'-phosphate oxidase superfamily)